MDELRFTLENDPRAEGVQRVVDGLAEYELSHWPHRDLEALAVLLRDDARVVAGGGGGLGAPWVPSLLS